MAERAALTYSLRGVSDRKKTSEFLFKQVGNKVAAAMLDALANDNNYSGSSPFYTTLQAGRIPQELAQGERARLRERLRSSGLAEALPAGLDLLPDIFENSPAMRWCGALARPRNLSEAVLHVCTFLNWYLDPAEPISFSRAVSAAILSPRAILITIVLSVLLVGMLVLLRTRVGALSFLFFAPQFWLWGAQSLLRRIGLGRDYKMRNEELFLYLFETYRLVPDEEPGSAQATAGSGAESSRDKAMANPSKCLSSVGDIAGEVSDPGKL